MQHHEHSPYLDDSLFKELQMPGLPVSFFYTLSNSADLYTKFRAMDMDVRHQVVDSFFSQPMVKHFEDGQERLQIIVADFEQREENDLKSEGMVA